MDKKLKDYSDCEYEALFIIRDYTLLVNEMMLSLYGTQSDPLKKIWILIDQELENYIQT